MQLVLDGGEVHRYIAAVGKAQGLDDVGAAQVRIEGGAQRAGLLSHASGIFREIYSDENVFKCGLHTEFSHRL